MKIAIIDLDNFVVDSSARAAVATQAGQGKIDWPTMFRGDLILSLDFPIPGSIDKLNKLAQEGLEIWYLTSREAGPAQSATIEWLTREGYPFSDNVICRPAFEKTVTFKTREVSRLHAERGPVILFGDDKEANRAAVGLLEIPDIRIIEIL